MHSVGRDAPWADGNVGMHGVSYLAATQIGAATFGDPERTKYLKALIPVAPVTSTYEFLAFDGVPFTGWDDAAYRAYVTALTFPHQRAADLQQIACQARVFTDARVSDGDFDEFYAAREYRRAAWSARPAVLFVQGLLDFSGGVRSPVAFFDRLPGESHKAIIGQFDHATPDGDNPRMGPVNRWPRTDAIAIEQAWFDHWLKGLPAGVEDWPKVQVQAIDGQWREERAGRRPAAPAGSSHSARTAP